MKYLVILIILSFCAALVYIRLRPYLAVIRRALAVIRAARQLNIKQQPTDAPARASSTTNEQLVHCAACGTWLPASRALILRATKTAYCSSACLERAAGRAEERKTAN